MGHIPYLTRLALGRSAFDNFVPPHHLLGANVGHGGEGQQYDEAGRPFNEASNASKEAQVRAMNEVLEVVGVTERKARIRAEELPKQVMDSHTWARIKAEEDEMAANIWVAMDLLHYGVTWPLDLLRCRIQAGFVDCSKPFASIVREEWQSFASSGSFVERYQYLTAGLELQILGRVGAQFSSDLWAQGMDWIGHKVSDWDLPSGVQKKLDILCGFLLEIGVYAINNLFCPLAVASVLRQCKIAKFSSGTLVNSLVPWAGSSPFLWGWSSGSAEWPASEQALEVLLSPLSLYMIFYTACFVSFGASDEGGLVASSSLNAPRHPDEYVVERRKPLLAQFLNDWMRWARILLLRVTGWSHDEYLKSRKPIKTGRHRCFGAATFSTHDLLATLGAGHEEARMEADEYDDRLRLRETSSHEHGRHRGVHGYRNPSSDSKADPRFRTSRLSTFMADLLGERVWALTSSMMVMPLEMLFYRSTVRAWQMRMQTVNGVAGEQGDGSSSVSRAVMADLRSMGWQGWGQMLSKMGLCIALRMCLDAAEWGGLWYWVQKAGKERFLWGQS